MLKRKGLEADEHVISRFMYLKDCNVALGERCSVLGACYFAHGHMFAYGYELEDTSVKALLQYSWGGASDNYLNLEYYNGPFDGRLAILPVVSWFVMHENRLPLDLTASKDEENSANERFRARGIDVPHASSYDICSLVNTAFRLG